MRSLIVVFALCALVACKKKPEDTSPPVSPTFDERQACGGDADCAVVELECCDHCNGGTVVGVHKDHAADVRKEHVTAGECEGTACTLMACPDAQPICREGRCGVSLAGKESLPDLPSP
jgi:hypothetical protein